jgi:DNA-binding CsgD family transcriptional regulator
VIPYQAWVQVLEQVLRHLPPEDIEPSIAVDLSVLGPLLPNLPHVGSRPPATLQGVDVERLRLFSAVDVLLAAVGRRWPSIVVLDDLHWGGPQTLSLLAHIARPSSSAPLLVLGTFRDTGDEITDQLAATLADLRRLDSVDRLRVAGLRDEDVAAFVAGAAGRDLDAALAKLAATVAERSRGNAFYVGELWRHLVATGAVVRSDLGWTVHPDVVDTAVPESVREVVVDRLARLAPAARRVAELVAVGGPVVELRVLLAAADVPAAEVTTALNELTAFGFLETVERPQLAYQFGHALVRDTIERAIPAASRAQLHLRLGDALESLYEPEWLAARPAMHRRTGAKVVGGRTSDSAVAGVGVLADLFRHYAAAASLGTAAKAVYYGRRAAEQAMQSLAANVATAYLERALELVPLHSQQWAETLVALAEAVVYDNRWAEAERYYEEAFHWARERGDARLAADAALGYEDSVHGEGLPGDAALRMVSEAIRMVGDDGSSLRTRLEAALARSQTHAGRLAEAEITLERALEMARAGEDDEALTIALVAAVVGATDPRRILDRTHELEQLAAQTGNYWTAAYATVFQLRAYTWLGELDRVRELAEHHRALGERLGHVMIVLEALPYEVTLALAEGRLADAEAAADRMLEIGADNWVAAPGMYGLHMFAIRREQGRLGEVLPVLEMMSRGGDADAVWGPGLAALYAELGRLDDARREFDALAPDRFRSIPRDALWPACATFLADVCVALGDKEHADVLYDDVLAFRGGTMMVGHTVSLGPADRLLGGLAALSGRNEAADAHFRVAHDLTDRVKAPAWRAHVDHDWARFRADRGDVESASRLLDAAHATAQRLGLAGLAAKCESLASAERAVAAAPADAYPDGLSAREVDVLKLVAQGCSNREIGERLLISANTAANHVRAILQKTACTNRAEAAAYAARNALID